MSVPWYYRVVALCSTEWYRSTLQVQSSIEVVQSSTGLVLLWYSAVLE